MPELLLSSTEFAKAAGVTQRAVADWAKRGRIPAYSENGRKVSPRFMGRKLFKLDDETRKSLDESKLRLDAKESAGIGQLGLAAERTTGANLQNELLRMRIAREHRELIPQSASDAALESLARAIQRAHKTIPGWAEELTAAAQTGGLGAVSGLLRAKSAELGNSVADLIAAEAECSADPEPCGSED